ncbi:MAG: DinB superfamily protein [Acidobacteriales bacterium]|nr:DinB superfamily protein [Terriglobales bacterium]
MNPIFAETLAAIDGATNCMTEEQLTFHPEGKWSTAEILEHLSLAFGGTAKGFERALSEGKPLGDLPTLRQRLQCFVVLNVGYFPHGRKSPPMVAPKGQLGGMEAMAQIRENLRRLDEMHGACEKKISRERCIANHPVLGPLTFNQWPKFHRIHTLHHMKQVAALRAAQR